MKKNSAAGFTLIEVIVAITILSICFVLIMQLFSNGLKSARTSCDYTKAVVLAKEKMEELSYNPVGQSGESGEGFKWETVTETYKEFEGKEQRLLKLKVTVSWDDMTKQKTVELVGLRMLTDDEEL